MKEEPESQGSFQSISCGEAPPLESRREIEGRGMGRFADFRMTGVSASFLFELCSLRSAGHTHLSTA